MISTFVLLLSLTLPQQPPAPAQSTPTDPREIALEQQAREIGAKLRCPTCQGLSISDSPAAQDMRDVIRAQLRSGKTPQQVEDYFVDKYGEWILLRPRAEGFNLAIYVLPVVMVLGGAMLVMHLAKKWSRGGVPPQSQEEELEPELR